MGDKVKRSQVALILLILLCAGKFLRLPAQMHYAIGRDMWLSLVLMFIMDLVGLLCVLWVINRNKDKSLYQILHHSIGKPLTKLVFALFAVFFFMRVLNMSVNMLELLTNTLMIRTNWLAFSLPLLAVVYFNLRKGFNATARLSEVLAILVLLSVIGVYAISSQRADFQNVLPFLENGFLPVLEGATRFNFWFGDYVFILLILEKITLKNNSNRVFNIPAAFAVGATVSVAMIVLFVALFGQTSWLHNSAMAKVSQYSIKETANGRLDWLDLVVWMMGLVIKIVVFSYCSVVSMQVLISQDLDKQQPKRYMIIIFCALVAIVPIFLPIADWIVLVASQWYTRFILWIPLYVVPYALPLAYCIHRQKNLQQRQHAD